MQIAPRLAQHRRVVLMDLRGHGRSSMPRQGYSPGTMAGDLLALLDHLGVDAAHLVGHSYGGCVALEFAWRHSERVSSLIIADSRMRSVQPTINFDHWKSGQRYRECLLRAGVEIDDKAEDVAIDLFERLARLRLERPAAMEELQTHLPSPFGGATGDIAARRWLELLEGTTARRDFLCGEQVPLDELAALDIKTCLLFGEYSQALPSAYAIKHVLPSASLEIVPAAGHFFPLSKPEAVIRRVLELTRIDTAAVLMVSQ
jgi:pimeloyl-ACP methyl ester carboxylesterase